MPEMEISVQDFSKLFQDVENMKYEFDCNSLDCCLTSRRLLILSRVLREQETTSNSVSIQNKNKSKIKHVYYAVGGGKDGQSCYSTYCLPSPEEEVEVDIDCMCEMFRPYELNNEGSYRCVEPRRLLQAMETVEELVNNGYMWEKEKNCSGWQRNFISGSRGRVKNMT